jgi:hypothetical protein
MGLIWTWILSTYEMPHYKLLLETKDFLWLTWGKLEWGLELNTSVLVTWSCELTLHSP